jgi:hypothetical protein
MKTVLLLFCLVASACGQHTCPEREIVINVLNKWGSRVAGITTSQLHATVGGKPLEVVALSRFYSAPRIVLLLDTSGSMDRGRKAGLTSLVVDSLLASIPQESQVGLIVFSSKPELVVPLGSARDTLAGQIAKLVADPKPWHGRTATLQAISEAILLFGTPRPADTIFLISDGGQTGSFDDRGLKHRLVESGVRVFGHLMSTEKRHSEMDRGEFGRVQDVVEYSGGAFVFASTEDSDGLDSRNVKRYSSAIAGRSTTGYLLKLRFSAPIVKWARLKVYVKDSVGKPDKEFALEYPAEIAPCPAPSVP